MNARAVAAAFDAIVMVALAYAWTGGSFADRALDVVLWGSAGAGVVAALVVFGRGPAELGWVAIGYIVFAGLLASGLPLPIHLLLAIAFVPLLPRPRGSLVMGLAIAALVAIGSLVIVRAL